MIAEVSQYVAVASFAEAWIEMNTVFAHPTTDFLVASFAEAWIEILLIHSLPVPFCRLLRGGVD